ncbi:hypothetical protein OESDEN_06840 [Oesophagostomum dentatum]|uniref:Uncharacterized protein n=1 Tax=Oesophagostomum dentatum TaxID=61180 RepID=A0A0B1TD22_OESDE|nr:hypothetical protein OESDEN_06840 [Oesophagostomum dentatum]
MYAVARKHGASSFIEYMPFIGAFLIFCSFYSFLLCTDAFHTLLYSHNKLMIACSLHFYMALTIFLFAFCYD